MRKLPKMWFSKVNYTLFTYSAYLLIFCGCSSDANPSTTTADSSAPVIEGWDGFIAPKEVSEGCIYSADILVCGDKYAKPNNLGQWHDLGNKSFGLIAWGRKANDLTLLSLANPYEYIATDSIKLTERRWNQLTQQWTFQEISVPRVLNSLLGRRTANCNSFAYINGELTLIREDWQNTYPKSFVETYSLIGSEWQAIDTITLPLKGSERNFMYRDLKDFSIISGDDYFCMQSFAGDRFCNVNNDLWVTPPDSFAPSENYTRDFRYVGASGFFYSARQKSLWNPGTNKSVSVDFPAQIISEYQGSLYAINKTTSQIMTVDSVGEWQNFSSAEKVLALRGFYEFFISDTLVIAVPSRYYSEKFMYSYKIIAN